MKQVKAGGVDILSHLIEYYLTDDTPVPDGRHQRNRHEVVVEYLPRAIAHPDDIGRAPNFPGQYCRYVEIARLGGGGGT